MSILPVAKHERSTKTYKPSMAMYLRRIYKPKQMDLEWVALAVCIAVKQRRCGKCIEASAPPVSHTMQIHAVDDAAAVHIAQDSVSAKEHGLLSHLLVVRLWYLAKGCAKVEVNAL